MAISGAIIGNIETVAFEDDACSSGNKAAQFPAAFRTDLQRIILYTLKTIKIVFTFPAFIPVSRHILLSSAAFYKINLNIARTY